MLTTMSATQLILCHFINDKASTQKVRDEFKRLAIDPAVEKDSSLKDLKQFDLIDKVLNFETGQELDYLSCVINEVLRFGGPAS